MSNHLSPKEMASLTGMDPEEVIKVCAKENIPVYKGKIDKGLFLPVLKEHPLQNRSTQHPS